MKNALVILLLCTISSFGFSQSPKLSGNKNYSFTGKKIDASVITAGVDYTPPAKVKTIITKMGVADIKFKKIEANDVVAVVKGEQKLVCIPNAVATKLEANDKSAFMMVAFAIACLASNAETDTKAFVKQSDRKAVKYMKENMDASLNDVKIAYNKILATSEIADYPTKEERIKIVEQIFTDKPVTTNGVNNGGGNNEGGNNGVNDNGANNAGNNGANNNNSNCQQNKTGTVEMINKRTRDVTVTVYKEVTVSSNAEQYTNITVQAGKTANLYEVSEGVHAWKEWGDYNTGQINLTKCQTATIIIE